MSLAESREPTSPTAGKPEFTAAEIGALAHLYRGEVYRSTVWRTRLDSSTNWAVVTIGISAVRNPQQCGGLALAYGTCWASRHRLPSVRGSSIPVLQCLARTRTPAGD